MNDQDYKLDWRNLTLETAIIAVSQEIHNVSLRRTCEESLADWESNMAVSTCMEYAESESTDDSLRVAINVIGAILIATSVLSNVPVFFILMYR